MDNYSYLCHYCGKDYIPKRRLVQKFCSDSCRSRAYQLRNKNSGLQVSHSKKVGLTKIDKMSIAGVGNAMAGTLAVNALTSLFISEENKPATKKDLQNLIGSLKQRYYPVMNIPITQDGSKAYYDMETKNIVYLKSKWS